MANDLVPYSQALSDPASTASSLETTDVMAIAREDADKPTGFKSMVFRLLTLAKKIVSGIDYSTELTETSNKTITGAINEVASMAANVDITTLLDTPAPIQTFSDGGDNIPMKSCEVAIVAQQASGTPSPSNPLPITGFSSVNVAVSSKNLWANGDVTFTGNNTSVNLYQPLPPNIYTISTIVTSNDTHANTCALIVYYTDGTNSSIFQFSRGSRTSITLTPSKYIQRLAFYSSDNYAHGGGDTATWADIQVEQGDQMTAYEAPTTTPVSLGQTIYGGTAELVGGNGIKTWESLTDLANGDWSSQGEGDYQFFALSVSGADATRLAELLCNKYRTLTPGLTNTDDNIVGIISSGTVLRIRDKRYNASTINDFKASLSDCVVIFPKATPTAFTFTGANIPTLSGTNNIYSNCGDINALEYFNDKADDIASMVKLMTRT